MIVPMTDSTGCTVTPRDLEAAPQTMPRAPALASAGHGVLANSRVWAGLREPPSASGAYRPGAREPWTPDRVGPRPSRMMTGRPPARRASNGIGQTPTMNETRAPSEDGGLHPAARQHPSKLFVEVTTRCNLRCAMCPKYASGSEISEGDLALDAFARLEPALPHLDALILNGIGEPLLHRHLERFIEVGRQALPARGWVGFQTNGQLLHRDRARSLVNSGVDRVCISVDAVSPELFHSLRVGGKQEAVENAASAIDAAARESHRDVWLGVEFVAMRENVRQLPDLVRWAARNHVRFVIVTHMLAYGQGTTGAAFEPVTDLTLQAHRECKERAAADGLDLPSDPACFLKPQSANATATERRVMDFFWTASTRASSEGIWIRPDWLARGCDESLARQVEVAFAEASEIAEREGIDLRLPAIVPRRVRRCDFVEDGSLFVSWNGDTHPCYFLWHRYRCHIGGLTKQVKPVSFGNLADADVLSLWGSAGARAFRDAVLRYDYSFCYDCIGALCDRHQEAEFTLDCLQSPVPCGGCLWATGVFQCLR